MDERGLLVIPRGPYVRITVAEDEIFPSKKATLISCATQKTSNSLENPFHLKKNRVRNLINFGDAWRSFMIFSHCSIFFSPYFCMTGRGQGPPSPRGQIPCAAPPRRQALAAARHCPCGAGRYAATGGRGPCVARYGFAISWRFP